MLRLQVKPQTKAILYLWGNSVHTWPLCKLYNEQLKDFQNSTHIQNKVFSVNWNLRPEHLYSSGLFCSICPPKFHMVFMCSISIFVLFFSSLPTSLPPEILDWNPYIFYNKTHLSSPSLTSYMGNGNIAEIGTATFTFQIIWKWSMFNFNFFVLQNVLVALTYKRPTF